MNISELARELGVAASTVSRVLSGKAEKYRISESTVARVREAAERYQVSPDPLGAGLRKGKSGIVGLLVPDITNPFFSQLARAIELRLRSIGIAVQLCDSAEDSDTELDLLRTMMGRRLDALVVAPVGRESEELEQLLRTTPMPVVMVDRPLSGVDLPSVGLDHRSAGRLAADRLFEAGHRRIGCLRGDPGTRADGERFAGVLEAAARAGVDPGEILSAGSGYGPDESNAAAETLLSDRRRPTAILTLGGQGILGLLAAVRRRKLAVPADLSIIAFDEQPWSALIEPPLTTVAQPLEEMAEELAGHIEQLLILPFSKTSRTPKQFQAVLVERMSVASTHANS